MRRIWERIKQLPIPRLLRNKYLITGLLFLIWILLFDPINLIDWVSERHKLYRLQKEKKVLEKQIEITTQKIGAFSHPDSLEKVAREQFYFVGPDEEIFVVEE